MAHFYKKTKIKEKEAWNGPFQKIFLLHLTPLKILATL